ncbi:Ig-like domain-containing protein, partial [Pseudomonas aeruginosa]
SSVTVDSVAPATPVINPSNGTTLSGTAEPGSSVTLTGGNGNPIGKVTADGSGNWSFTPGIPLQDGTVVNVVARSPSNVDSAPAVITVDGVAPAALIDPSNGTEISGTVARIDHRRRRGHAIHRDHRRRTVDIAWAARHYVDHRAIRQRDAWSEGSVAAAVGGYLA